MVGLTMPQGARNFRFRPVALPKFAQRYCRAVELLFRKEGVMR